MLSNWVTGVILVCKIPLLARRTRPVGQARRSTIGYLVYKGSSKTSSLILLLFGLYTSYHIVARALGLAAAFRPGACKAQNCLGPAWKVFDSGPSSTPVHG